MSTLKEQIELMEDLIPLFRRLDELTSPKSTTAPATPSADTPAPECEHGWMLANRLTQYQLDMCHDIGIPPRVKLVCSYCEAQMWSELASLDPVS